MEALKATDDDSPNFVKKKTDAPSRIPNSPREIGGIILFTNMIRFPAHK